MKLLLTSLLIMSIAVLQAQTIAVEYNKQKDMTVYKTFQFGEMEVIVPKEKRVFDEIKIRALVNDYIERELKEKRLQRVDSNAHLVVSYVIGSMERSSVFNAGPLGGTPGVQSQGAVMRDYNEGSFIIDLNDRSDNLIWRINAITNFTPNNVEGQIDQVLEKGFKKFPNKPKVKKK